ncbi:uncharacterized protein LOC120699489 [Panicum virgatum]|uniref:uncharacterized protein LOC120699489 n=1 Tax=Panicum virgatum TaxID=38727 RepID=UPI0019D5D7E1|nr:uncharacterized protein LOC120699489 [Panicum virgatum]
MQRPASFLPSRRGGAPSMGSRSGARAPWLPLPHSCPEGSTRPPPPAPPSASCAVTAHGCSGNTTGGSGNSTGGGAVKRSAGHLCPMWAWGCIELVAAGLLGGPLASGDRSNTAVAIRVSAASGLVVIVCSRRMWTLPEASKIARRNANVEGSNMPVAAECGSKKRFCTSCSVAKCFCDHYVRKLYRRRELTHIGDVFFYISKFASPM